MSEKVVNRNVLKFLTPKQKRVLDVFIEALGADHTSAKRSVMKTIAKTKLGTGAAPAWITRNPNLRSKESRGNYDLSVLTKLSVKEVPEEPVRESKTSTETTAPAKTKKAPPAKKKAVVKKKVSATKKTAPVATKKKKETKKKPEPEVSVPEPQEEVPQVDLLPDEEELG